ASGAAIDAVTDAYQRQVSMQTFVTGEDIGEACAWLLSPGARYVSGQILSVDGNTETLRTV
ncbi:MAG: SDR family oxidoreductase, partial [Actinomycetota bacterium]